MKNFEGFKISHAQFEANCKDCGRNGSYLVISAPNLITGEPGMYDYFCREHAAKFGELPPDLDRGLD